MERPKRIVLTGGPGGGKTTAADLLRREIGEKVVIVPESATVLFSGGFPRPGVDGVRAAVQRAIYHTQLNIEKVQSMLYPGRTLLCDRGTLDGAAYWPKEEKRDFFEALNTTLDDELSRYDAVIFFESAAVGDIDIEGGNPVRTESVKEAAELDRKLRRLWSRHRDFTLIPHNPSFFQKLTTALDCLLDKIDQ